MTETSSPTVVPALTKTDAKDLKALVRRDTKIVREELSRRRDDFQAQLQSQFNERQAVVKAERQRRQDEETEEAKAALAGIQDQINAVNESIVETVTELVAQGWTYGSYGGIPSPHDFTVAASRLDTLRPPGRDDSDLDEQSNAIVLERAEAMEQLINAYGEAVRGVDIREAEMLRELTLQSITTEAAREFILDMPTANDLLPAPEGVEALSNGDEE